MLVAGCSFVGYLVAGFTESAPITLVASIALLLLCMAVLHRRAAKRHAA